METRYGIGICKKKTIWNECVIYYECQECAKCVTWAYLKLRTLRSSISSSSSSLWGKKRFHHYIPVLHQPEDRVAERAAKGEYASCRCQELYTEVYPSVGYYQIRLQAMEWLEPDSHDNCKNKYIIQIYYIFDIWYIFVKISHIVHIVHTFWT